MSPLTTLLCSQKILEEQQQNFLKSLEPSRTVTLRELILDQNGDAKERLSAPWLNHELVRTRLDAMMHFFQELGNNPRLRPMKTLFFFQSALIREDAGRHSWLRRNDRWYWELYCMKFGATVPATVRYLHTNPVWWNTLRGKYGARLIPPMGGFSQRGFDGFSTSIIGYRIPNLPNMLNVSDNIATDYLLRSVVHDIGHMRLPKLCPSIDSLHNTVMIRAMHVQDQKPYRTPWEELIDQEATNPFFFIDGMRLLTACENLTLSPLQRYLFRKLQMYYASPKHEKNLERLWDITSTLSERARKAQAQRIIEEMCTDGFMRYNLAQ